MAGKRVAAASVDLVDEAGEEGGAVFLNCGFRISDFEIEKTEISEVNGTTCRCGKVISTCVKVSARSTSLTR